MEPETKTPEPETKAEPVPKKYLAVETDVKNVQYGLPVYVQVEGEWVETATYVERCRAPIKTDSGRKRPDGSPIYDISRNAAEWDDVKKEIAWPDDKIGSTAVFLGLPYFRPNTEEPVLSIYDVLIEAKVIDRSADDKWPGLKLVYRDIKGKTATNCAVYLIEED